MNVLTFEKLNRQRVKQFFDTLQRPAPFGAGLFCGLLRHFSLKYVRIPAKNCLAQRKNPSLPVTL